MISLLQILGTILAFGGCGLILYYSDSEDELQIKQEQARLKFIRDKAGRTARRRVLDKFAKAHPNYAGIYEEEKTKCEKIWEDRNNKNKDLIFIHEDL